MVMEADDEIYQGALDTPFQVKLNGPMEPAAGGMVRSSSARKTDYTLAMDGVMFERWAAHLTRATQPPTNYPKRNWLLALKGTAQEREAVVERARESAMRHMAQWLRGDRDEDHAAAVYFNINVVETIGSAT